MILGTGNDITDIRRVEELLEKFGKRFEDRVFTPAEQKTAQGKKKSGTRAIAASYAKRFAAKEACAKALGTGFRGGMSWRDIEVYNTAEGKPCLQLSGAALERLRQITPPTRQARLHLALTDEHPYAQASVIIEAI